jgi:CHAD domain-containing protein
MTVETLSVEALLEQHAVDREHARHVADLALLLFDELTEVHNLPPETRPLLEMGALLHNVGLSSDPAQHHTVGRDIVLNADLEELSPDERNLVACLVAFHRKKVHPNAEPAYLSLKKKEQAVARRLAALLRVADGLDYSQSQTTQIHVCEIDRDRVLLRLTGRDSAEDGARAGKKADLWRRVFDRKLVVEQIPITGEAGMGEALPLEDSDQHLADQVAATESATPGNTTTPLAEVGQRILRRNMRKLLSQERNVRADTDIEAVHQLRVATRRLRAVLASLDPVAPTKQVRTYRKELRRLARASSAVRDCDVFLAEVDQYAASLPEEQRPGLEPLTAALQQDRAKAREILLKQLASRRYADFKRTFTRFTSDGREDWNNTLRVRDLAGSTIWRSYEGLRAYELTIDPQAGSNNPAEALHQARIAGKRLRYVLEMFAETLGPDADQVIDPLKELQDHLGALQDVAVAAAYIHALAVPADARPVLEAYITHRERERDQLLADLPRIWGEITGEGYRRMLLELLVRL